ncbi:MULTISPECIES: hypothetical protein [Oceanospirillaceae]|jgi:putative heme iron utilization protein|uniref:Uncharacterized protein n=1 Tax=Oceanobacter antarcticus TaxID=3133425 RepID=A0ABW8NIJ5_9GAMM|tara:strand:- start:4101 stop:4256 length:156 start_codon:yes stop_codon:yes gene_type:complete
MLASYTGSLWVNPDVSRVLIESEQHASSLFARKRANHTGSCSDDFTGWEGW